MSVFEKLTVSGKDISNFSIYVDGDSSVNSKVSIKTVTYAEKLSALFEEKYIGKALPIAEKAENGNYIVLSGHSTDANAYSVKILNGNISKVILFRFPKPLSTSPRKCLVKEWEEFSISPKRIILKVRSAIPSLIPPNSLKTSLSSPRKEGI